MVKSDIAMIILTLTLQMVPVARRERKIVEQVPR